MGTVHGTEALASWIRSSCQAGWQGRTPTPDNTVVQLTDAGAPGRQPSATTELPTTAPRSTATFDHLVLAPDGSVFALGTRCPNGGHRALHRRAREVLVADTYGHEVRTTLRLAPDRTAGLITAPPTVGLFVSNLDLPRRHASTV